MVSLISRWEINSTPGTRIILDIQRLPLGHWIPDCLGDSFKIYSGTRMSDICLLDKTIIQVIIYNVL